MKKIMTAILLFDLAAGLLFFIFYGLKNSAVAADSGMVRIVEGEEGLEAEDVKKIAITFDDGPHPYYTEQLLDGLKERNVVATFFVTGDCVIVLPD